MSYEFPFTDRADDLKALFTLTESYELLETTFYGGGVETFEEFQKALSNAHVYGVVHDDELVGFTWLNMWMGRSAAVHVCLWPTADREHIVPIGRAFLQHVLNLKNNGAYYRDSLFGLTPANYHNVVKYAQDIGMIFHAEIPGAAIVRVEVISVKFMLMIEECSHVGIVKKTCVMNMYL